MDVNRTSRLFREVSREEIAALFQAALDRVKTPRLLHTDMWEGNVLLTNDCREIAAIIDGNRAVFGDVDFEFASGWGACLAPLCGREPPEAGSPDRRERMALYRMYYALLETYVWAAEYDGPAFCREKRDAVLALLCEWQESEEW